MPRLSRIVAAGLVLAVLLIFVAPAVDLEPSALRASKAAVGFFAAIACLILLPYPVTSAALQPSLFERLLLMQGSSDVLDLTCSRLC